MSNLHAIRSRRVLHNSALLVMSNQQTHLQLVIQLLTYLINACFQTYLQFLLLLFNRLNCLSFIVIYSHQTFVLSTICTSICSKAQEFWQYRMKKGMICWISYDKNNHQGQRVPPKLARVAVD